MKKILDNKIFKIFFGILETLVFGLLILYLLFVSIQRFSGNKSIFGYRVFTVATGSMKPVYNVNDVIVVKNVDTNTLKVGDDIAYLGNRAGLEGLIISHRIIKIENEDNGEKRIFTKGVNNDNPDPSISENQVIGKIQGKLLIINIINHIVKNQYGFFFLVFCPLIFVIAISIAQSVIESKYEYLLEEEEMIKSNNKKIEEVKVKNKENKKVTPKEGIDEDEEVI